MPAHQLRTLEDSIAYIGRQKWHFNGLWQLEPKLWRCSIRFDQGQHCYEDRPTPLESANATIHAVEAFLAAPVSPRPARRERVDTSDIL